MFKVTVILHSSFWGGSELPKGIYPHPQSHQGREVRPEKSGKLLSPRETPFIVQHLLKRIHKHVMFVQNWTSACATTGIPHSHRHITGFQEAIK